MQGSEYRYAVLTVAYDIPYYMTERGLLHFTVLTVIKKTNLS
jgi:hypothetical protein